MYLPTKLRVIFFSFLVKSLISTTIAANLTGYPPPGKPPHIKKAWKHLLNESMIPDVPQVPTMGDCTNVLPEYCNWSCQHCNKPSDLVVCPVQNDWGLTFDDGPSDYTPALLDYLESKNLRATFFVIGAHVVQYPDVLKRAVLGGHQIGIHTYSHTALTTQSNEEIVAELKWTEKAIKEAAGVTPKYVRPPFGDMDDRVRSIFDQLGYTPVIWDFDSSDWMSNSDPTFQLSWVTGNFSEWVQENHTTGHISLQHDFWEQTADQGPSAIDIVSGGDFNIKTIAECQGQKPYLEEAPTPTKIQPYQGNSSDLPYPDSDSDNQNTNSALASNAISNSTLSLNSTSNSTASSSENNAASQDKGTPASTPNSSPSKGPIKMPLIMGLLICAIIKLTL